MQQRIFLIFTTVSVIAFSGCGKKDEGATASGSGGRGSGAYVMEENGCNTGRHSYGSNAQYCQMLLDDALNNYCARGMREQDYEARCGKLPESAASISRPRTINNPVTTPGTDSGTDVTASGSQTRRKFPRQLTIMGRLTSDVGVKSSRSNGAVVTTLEGSFTTSLEADYRVELSLASKIEFADMPEECVLSVKNFTSMRSGQTTVQFTLVGIDTRSEPGVAKSCAATLRRFARYGFQARFLGAYLVTPTAGVGQATVNLSVF